MKSGLTINVIFNQKKRNNAVRRKKKENKRREIDLIFS